MIDRIQSKEGYLIFRPSVDPVKCRPESAEQIDFVSWVRYNYPREAELLFHVTNEGDQPPQYRVQLYKMGLLKGTSDLILLTGRGAVFEMKREAWSARPSKEQKKFLRRAVEEGRFACVVNGAEAAKAAFLEFLEERQ